MRFEIKMVKLEEGIIQLYTGNGKGKTTAAFGLAARALGRGLKVCFIQFLKGGNLGDGCAVTLGDLEDFDFASYGTGRFISKKPTEEDRKEATRAFLHAKKAILGEKYDLVILDEITHAVRLNLIELGKILDLLKNKPKNVEVVLTGRDADPNIIEMADLITDMKKIKHPYDKRLQAREGIEY